MALAPRFHAPLPPSRRPRELAPAITDALRAVDARLRAACASVDPSRYDVPRADGGWSIGQVLEHLALTNETYLTRMAPMIAQLTATPPADVPWQATWISRWLARSLEMQMPLPAPKRITPGPTPRPGVLDAVIGTHDALRSYLAVIGDRDWRAVRMVSPLNALVRPNAGDAFVIVLRHSERHTAQLEQIAAAQRRLTA